MQTKIFGAEKREVCVCATSLRRCCLKGLVMSAVPPWMTATSSILQLSGSSGSGGSSISCRPTFCLSAPARQPNCRWALARSTDTSPFSWPSPTTFPKVSGMPRTTACVKLPYGHILAMMSLIRLSGLTLLVNLLCQGQAVKIQTCNYIQSSKQLNKDDEDVQEETGERLHPFTQDLHQQNWKVKEPSIKDRGQINNNKHCKA